MSTNNSWYKNISKNTLQLLESLGRNDGSIEYQSFKHRRSVENCMTSSLNSLSSLNYERREKQPRKNKILFNQLNNPIDKEINLITLTNILKKKKSKNPVTATKNPAYTSLRHEVSQKRAFNDSNPYRNTKFPSVMCQSKSSMNKYSVTKFEFIDAGESFDVAPLTVQKKDRRIKLSKHNNSVYHSLAKKRGTIVNQVADIKAKHLINKKTISKRERYQNDTKSKESLPLVKDSQQRENMFSDMKINLPSHYWYFHVCNLF